MREYLLVLLGPSIWVIKSLTYMVTFRIRKIPVTVLSCFIIGGAPYLLLMIPIPFAGYISFPLAIGLAVFLTMRYTHIELIPNGLFIPLSIEVLFRVAIWAFEEFGPINLTF
jgi:hypothetical protein